MLTHYGRRLGLALAAGALLTCSGMPTAAFADDTNGADEASSPTTTNSAPQSDESEPAPSEGPSETGAPTTDADEPSPSDEATQTPTEEPSDGNETPVPTEGPTEQPPSEEPPTDISDEQAEAPQPTTKRETRAAAADCTPTDRSDSVTDVTITEAVEDDGVFNAWERTRIDFSGSLPDGGCAGDTVSISLPPELNGMAGTFPVLAADGTRMGTMVVSNGGAVITFNDYVETHQNISYQGFLQAQLDDTLEPGGEYELEINVGSETFPVPIETGDCPSCENPITWTGKYANYDDGTPEPGDERVNFGLTTAETKTAGELITITDTVDAGQEINCDSIRVRMGDSRNAWGDVIWDGMASGVETTCSATTVTVTFRSTAAGQYFRLNGTATVTEALPSYTDHGQITQAGKTSDVSAEAKVYSGGVDGNGDTPQPKIDIEKWSTLDGPIDGDFDDSVKDLSAADPTAISFTITNTGTEALRDVRVSDATTSGVGTISGLSCDFGPLGGPVTGTTWAGPFKVGDSFTCTGTLPKLGNDAMHTDRATVTGIGVKSGTTVTDQDDWSGKTPNALPGTPPVETPEDTPEDEDTPTVRPVDTPQGGSTPQNGQTPTAGTLPDTGANQGLLPLGLAALAMVVAGGALAWRGRRSLQQG